MWKRFGFIYWFMENFWTYRSNVTQSYCYMFLREFNFAKMEQVHISQFTQTCILKGTKVRGNCQNTDLYQQTVSELTILWDPGASSLFQGELSALPFWLEMGLREWELARLLLIFHSNSFQHRRKSYFNKKENEDPFTLSFTRSLVVMGFFGNDIDSDKENSHAETKIEKMDGIIMK